MNGFIACMQKIMELMQYKFMVYGHSVSFWDVFIWCFVTSVLIAFIVNLLSD